MQLILDSDLEIISGAYSISYGGYTLSNGGNNANSWYQAGVWASGGALGGGLAGFAGFAGSFTLTYRP